MHTHIVLSSHNRINYNNTLPAQCQINLNKKITANCAELSYFMCPNTFWNVTNKNNTFLLNGGLITIDPGCYTLNQLLTEILTLLPAGSNILYNDVLNKMEITLLAASTLDFSISRSYLLLGYEKKQYAANTSFISSFPPKVYTTAIFVETNLSSNIVSDLGYHSTFCIPVNVNKGELCQFHNRTMFSSRPKVKNNEISNISFILKDEYNEVLQGAGDFTAIIAVAEKVFDPQN